MTNKKFSEEYINAYKKTAQKSFEQELFSEQQAPQEKTVYVHDPKTGKPVLLYIIRQDVPFAGVVYDVMNSAKPKQYVGKLFVEKNDKYNNNLNESDAQYFKAISADGKVVGENTDFKVAFRSLLKASPVPLYIPTPPNENSPHPEPDDTSKIDDLTIVPTNHLTAPLES